MGDPEDSKMCGDTCCKKAAGGMCALGVVRAVILCAALLSVFTERAMAGPDRNNPVIFGENEQAALEKALGYMDMNLTDMEFAKDLGKPRMVLNHVRAILHKPLLLPETAEQIVEIISGGGGRFWNSLAGLLDCGDVVGGLEPAEGMDVKWSGVPRELAASLQKFYGRALTAQAHLDESLRGLSASDRKYLACVLFADTFLAEDHSEVRSALAAMGADTGVVARVIEESKSLDPEPATSDYLDLLGRMKMADLIEAGRIMQSAADELAAAVAGMDAWPTRRVTIATAEGPIVVGTCGSDSYSRPALLILDPGGDDHYDGPAAGVNGVGSPRLGMVVDLRGDDTYSAREMVGPGAALFGVGIILDLGGRDNYRCAYSGEGAGFYGVGMLHDGGGDDAYEAGGLAQGAGVCGVGDLRDDGGDDVYKVGLCGQAYAGVYGLGFLVEAGGDDCYTAGGREPDHERHDDRFLSLGQGFATGLRPFGGGGIAVLLDMAGNDRYTADIFGQGVSYWYSLGMLVDLGGNDIYSVYHYGQGSGIHLSAGLLYDAGGNDEYYGHILVQGNAHDYGVGMLIDHQGADRYVADHDSQGKGMNNAVGLLVDDEGDDIYLCSQPELCQGIGNSGGDREYGSLGMLLDLNGTDFYSCGAENSTYMLRPLYGVVYDAE